MPKGNPGMKRPALHPTEVSIQALKDNNIKRGLETRKMWEQIAADNEMKCRTCHITKVLDEFSPRKNKDYNMWVKQCRLCENFRKNKTTHRRMKNASLEKNIKYVMRGAVTRANNKNMLFDIDVLYLTELFHSQNGLCKYSSRKMSFEVSSPNRLSIDRIDSNKGYIKGNVVWCCWVANNIKQDLSNQQFSDWISDINTTFQRRQRRNSI